MKGKFIPIKHFIGKKNELFPVLRKKCKTNLRILLKRVFNSQLEVSNSIKNLKSVF